jgi:serine/threonine/tyrosine protein kinase RAD53
MQQAAYSEPDDAMMAYEAMNDGLEQTQQTQMATQGTVGAMPSIDAHLWGFLQPCTGALLRIDFWKASPVYDIGRNKEGNQIVLPGFKVSEYPAQTPTVPSLCFLYVTAANVSSR